MAADSVRLHYLDWGGRGETLLFLPGLGSTAHVFDDIAPALTDDFRVLALTPRAHGQSDTPDTTYTVADAAADILALLDALAVDRAHLVAHSLSASAITRFAARHPDRVGRLVYIDATFDYGGEDELAMDDAALPRPWPEGGLSSAAQSREWYRRYFFGTWSDALEADMRLRAAANTEEGKRRASAHAALLADVVANPKEYAQVEAPTLAERPDAAVVAFPAHHWVLVTDQERVLRLLRDFLRPNDTP